MPVYTELITISIEIARVAFQRMIDSGSRLPLSEIEKILKPMPRILLPA